MSTEKTIYCLGFAFFCDRVVLIEKKRPDWQRGFLNGIGGKVEKNETPQQAMTREFIEETGVNVRQEQWHFVGVLNDPTLKDAEVHIFVGDLGALQTITLSDQIVHQRNIALVDKDYEVICIVGYDYVMDLKNNNKFLHGILDLLIETSQIYSAINIGAEIKYQPHVFKSRITKL